MTTPRTIAKNVAILLAGSLVSQVLRFVYVSLLARYIGLEGFGRVTTASTLVSVLMLVVGFGLDRLVIRDVAHDRDRAGEYVVHVALLRLLLTLLLAGGMLLARPFVPYAQETQVLIGLYFFVYVFDAFYNIIRSLFHAYQKMEYASGLDLGRDLLNFAVSILGIQLDWPVTAIIGVSAAANLLKLVVGAVVMRARFVRPTPAFDVGLSRRLLRGALPFLLLAGVNVASERLSTVFLSWIDTPAAVGLYSAAVFPITTLLLLPGIFYESIFPVFSEYHRASPAELRTSYRISYKLMLILGFPMGAGIMLISRPLLVLMYGPDFEAAYVIMNILAVQLFAIVGYANGALLNATGREKLFAGLRTAFTLLNVVLSLVLIPRYSYVGAALAVSIPVLLDFFIYSYLSHRYIRLAYPWGTLARVAFSTLVMSAPAYLALRMGVNLFLVVSFAPFLYLVALLGFRAIDTDDWQIAKQIIPVKRGVT